MKHSLLKISINVLVLLAPCSLALAQESNIGSKRMWVIYSKTETANPKPGTFGAMMPIFEMYYDANTVRMLGQKRFVESTSCGYRRWEPGEPMTGYLYCKLDDKATDIIGIDCIRNSYLYSGLVDASPDWKPIRQGSSVASLKKELC
jgi:hypothetical protein